jgi:hypothetical protein
MRTVEVLFVIIILLSAFFITTYFAVLPSPSQAFGTNLRELSQSTLETLDAEGILSETVFKPDNDPAWADLQKALSASLPPNIVYNLSVYDLSPTEGVVTYDLEHSISDASSGVESRATSLLVASPDITYTQDPQKIACSEQNITLYILNCEDANGWWITGFTGQSLATEFYGLLSPYFETTVLVNSTSELESLLNGNLLTSKPEERVRDAVVINTFGEAVPISSTHAYEYWGDYANYTYFLGQMVNSYNWTWASIVGYPFYYVTNTEIELFRNLQNTKGIFGMERVGPVGLEAFLEGLTGKSSDDNGIMTPLSVVSLSPNATELCNYYGIYPSPNQTASRALKDGILVGDYGLVATELFNRLPDNPLTPTLNETSYIPAATYENMVGGVRHGALTAIGLARIPDVRVTALALLMYYQPSIYKSVFGASDTSRLVTLQLGQQGGT